MGTTSTKDQFGTSLILPKMAHYLSSGTVPLVEQENFVKNV